MIVVHIRWTEDGPAEAIAISEKPNDLEAPIYNVIRDNGKISLELQGGRLYTAIKSYGELFKVERLSRAQIVEQYGEFKTP